MKRFANFLMVLLLSLLVCGCDNTVFGVPKDQWDRLTPAQRDQVISAYNQRKQTETQNAPMMAAIGAASSVLNNQINTNAVKSSSSTPPGFGSPPPFNPPSFNAPQMPDMPN